MILAKLPELTQLKSLWLGHNCFSPLAAKCLVEALRTNFILEDINIRTLDNDPSWDTLQQDLDHYARLNRGGRRIFSSGMTNVPLGLWPLILERANRIYWGGTTSNASNETVKSHAADSIFSLLHGPALFANPCLPTQTYKHVTNYHT